MSNLVKHLESWGLDVVNHNKKGRPNGFSPRGIIVHHDASSKSSGNNGALGVIISGRSNIPGPLSQFQISRDGTVHLITTGRANHAGTGSWSWIPRNQGNTYAWGIEAANNGINEPWSKEQLEAYYILCAALLKWMGTSDVNKVIAHKEYAGGRKTDPRFNMDTFRSRVASAYRLGTTKPAPRKNIAGPKTHKGFENLYSWEMKLKNTDPGLKKTVFGIFKNIVAPRREAITSSQLRAVRADLVARKNATPVGMKKTQSGLSDRINYIDQLLKKK